MSAHIQPMADAIEHMFMPNEAVTAAAPAVRRGISVSIGHDIAAVEPIWRTLGGAASESPGQSYDFIRHWVRNRAISADDQLYMVADYDGQPIALLPLQRKRVLGVRVLTWFPGAQVGCHAPIVDHGRLAALTPDQRRQLWQEMGRALTGADVIYLRSIPVEVGGQLGLFDELGASLQTETLYRAQFSSWTQCDAEQRSRTRRKHDRQQGDRLAALGDVAFEEVTDPVKALAAVDIMFRQRSARFKAQNIRDPFLCDGLTGFYRDALEPGSGMTTRIHTLSLDDEVVAVRYNIVLGDRMFCLISSMADCERIQGGSPGKQCLLRVMQTVFDQGIRVFDMGAGYTDEKRHWCNVQIPLRRHYLALTPIGALAGAMHRQYQGLRAHAKSHAGIKNVLRQVSLRADALLGRNKPKSDQL